MCTCIVQYTFKISMAFGCVLWKNNKQSKYQQSLRDGESERM